MSLDINHNSFGQLSNLADSLIIELSDSYIKFCELQSNDTSPLYVCHYPIENDLKHSVSEHLINALKHFQFSKKSYKHVYINYFTPQFTLCPNAFYNHENNRALLEFNSGTIGSKFIVTDDVSSDIKLIFAIDEELKSTLDQLFPNHFLKHTLTVISKLSLASEEFIKEHIVLAINSDYIEVAVKQEQKLLLANQYSVKTQEDVLYYVLFILEQYHLNPLTTNIKIIGNIDASSSLILSLKKYIKYINLGVGHKTINWSNLNGMPQHFNYTLLNRLFCE